jgi:hypothetical protein
MIRKKTVFIVGAGANVEVGFPLGGDLSTAIIDLARGEREPRAESEAIRGAWPALLAKRSYLTDVWCGKHPLFDLADRFSQSGRESIDRFLADAPDLRKAGTAMIGLIISHCEQEDLLFDQPRFYRWLRRRMADSLDDLQQSPVTFVTFNYDRSLEYFIQRAMYQSHKDKIQAEAALKVLNVVHVYGSLGTLPPVNEHVYGIPEIQPFGAWSGTSRQEGFGHADLDRWATNIRLIGDGEMGRGDALDPRIHAAIRDAEVICFLGFGFDPQNMKVLGFPYLDPPHGLPGWYHEGRPTTEPLLMGTAFGLSEARRAETIGRMLLPPKLEPAAGHYLKPFSLTSTCEAFLEEHLGDLGAEYDLRSK